MNKTNEEGLKITTTKYRVLSWPQLKCICHFSSLVHRSTCTHKENRGRLNIKFNRYHGGRCQKQNCPLWQMLPKVESEVGE